MYKGQVHGAFDGESDKGSNGVYYFVKRVPKDLIEKVGRDRYSISLNTKDPKIAKTLFIEMLAEKEREFSALRSEPEAIPHKELVTLAGVAYRELAERRADEPGEESLWAKFIDLTDSVSASGEAGLEKWYGPTADRLLLQRALRADQHSRKRLIADLHKTYRLVGRRLQKNAQGDYSPEENLQRFPRPSQATQTRTNRDASTFEAIIDAEVPKAVSR